MTDMLIYRRKWTKTDITYLLFIGVFSCVFLLVFLAMIFAAETIWAKSIAIFVTAFCGFGFWMAASSFVLLVMGRPVLRVTRDRLDYVPAYFGKPISLDLSQIGPLRVGIASQPGSGRIFHFFALQEAAPGEGAKVNISLFGLTDTERGAERIAREIVGLRERPYVQTEGEMRMETITARVNKRVQSHLNWVVLYVILFVFGLPWLIMLFMR